MKSNETSATIVAFEMSYCDAYIYVETEGSQG